MSIPSFFLIIEQVIGIAGRGKPAGPVGKFRSQVARDLRMPDDEIVFFMLIAGHIEEVIRFVAGVDIFPAPRQKLWVKVGRNWGASLSITPQGFAVVRGVMESFLPWLR